MKISRSKNLSVFTLLGMLVSVSALAAESDWVTLLDGSEGLENFDRVGDANWSAASDAIEATEGNGASWLVTRESYGDFVLHVEFWVSDDANSGIYLRCQDPNTIRDTNCYEANIYDQRPDASYGTGGIVHIAAVEEPRPKAGGQWNTYHITLRGDHLNVVLNGETTVDVRDGQFASGPIALQWGRGVVRFRNVRVRSL